MDTHVIIGGALCLAGLADIGMIPVLRRRIQDENQQRILTVAMLTSATLMLGLGTLFLTGVIVM
ncbi:MAG: hypothetical protein HMLKMBBP_02465 [Planctomycetes bacterium]|nr:hypothetical protein [Planctomycetota bacterium]